VTSGEITQGHRRPNGTEPHELAPGEYALASDEAKIVWTCSPDGQPGHVTADLWTITVEPDQTVTVDPSIWWDKPTGWHGYLQQGVWRAV
jgi:hypothetical protein